VVFHSSLYAVNWIADFLTDRTQCIGTSSGSVDTITINRSIVQGSGLEPCFFLAYDMH
jgi:hypothetical protein